MAVLRIKETVEELLEKDPYELFTLDEPHRLGRKMRPEFFGAAFLGVVIAFAVAFFTFWNVQQDAKEMADAPYAYFEVKAIDPDGRLVAGAVVKEGDKALGVTDSFGEWRRFMRVKPGATVLLTVSKRTNSGLLTAVKNIAVPMTMPKGGDLELTGSVQLARAGTIKGVPAVKKNAPIREAEVKQQEIEQQEVGEATVIAADAEPARAVSDPVERAAVAPVVDPAATAATADLARVWIMTDGKEPGAPVALTEVQAALRKRARELGVKIDPQASWRIKLSELPATQAGAEHKPLIHVESTVDGADSHSVKFFSYLRNYQETSAQTARDILWAATVHVAKSHQVVRRDGIWVLRDESVKLWNVQPGRIVYDTGGIGYAVQATTEGPAAGLLSLQAANTEPCADGNACEVSSAGIRRASPVPGWERMKVKILGMSDADTAIYFSGYEAHRLQDKLYEYWGVPKGGANVTAVRGNRVVYRGRIQNGGATLPTVMLPSAPLSRR